MVISSNNQLHIFFFHMRDHVAQRIRLYIIIAVHKSYELALCLFQAPVSGCGYALVLLPDYTDTTILCGQFFCQDTGLIRWSVHDQENLQLVIGLAAETFYTTFQSFFTFIHRYYNTYHNRSHPMLYAFIAVTTSV